MFRDLCFARWGQGEVDLVQVDQARHKPRWALDVKWSDTQCDSANALAGLVEFAKANELGAAYMTSRTVSKVSTRSGACARSCCPCRCCASRSVNAPPARSCFEIAMASGSERLNPRARRAPRSP
jgi:hypothetical protein